MATCFFCLRDATLTRAHLLQTQFRDAIEAAPENRVYLASSSIKTNGIGRALNFPGDVRQKSVTSLCSDCNSNWMQSIEIAAAPTFGQLVRGELVPKPQAMLSVAHWAVVHTALSSELYPSMHIPEAHRTAIRSSPGLPPEYWVFCVWTSDYLAGMQTDLYRGTTYSFSPDPQVHWVGTLHAGAVVLVTASPDIGPRVARLLDEAEVGSVLGLVGEEMVYIPREWKTAMTTGPRPSHEMVHDLGQRIFGGSHGGYVPASNGQELLDLAAGLQPIDVPMNFDLSGRLFDYRELPGSAEHGPKQPSGRSGAEPASGG